MSKTTAGQWVKFFNTAGVPSPMAAIYAHIFVENRIQIDMVMDLNKEYLREMGITLMGDIIAILRHSKHVNEQTARDKILSAENPLPVAAVVANPVAPERKSTKISLNSKFTSQPNSVVIPLPKTPRRVLPEHEGKYTVKLPSGTTERSKEILAKKAAMLYADKEASSKPRIFERLSRTMNIDFEDLTKPSKRKSIINEQHQKVRITGIGSKPLTSTSSIFSRLGGKTEPDYEASSSSLEHHHHIKPILKKSSKLQQQSSSGSVTAISRAKSQKVLLVKKVPIKIDSDYSYDSDDDDVRMDTSGDKIVSFASEAEVREIAPRVVSIKPKNRLTTTGMKSRLGSGMHADRIHRTAKPVKLKHSPPQMKISPNKAQAIRMKSDELLRSEKPVYSRLGISPVRSGLSKLTNRIGRVSLTSNSKSSATSTNSSLSLSSSSPSSLASSSASSSRKKTTPSSKGGSVFERLGFAR